MRLGPLGLQKLSVVFKPDFRVLSRDLKPLNTLLLKILYWVAGTFAGRPGKASASWEGEGWGTAGSPSSLSVPPPRHAVQHRLFAWKAPLSKTKLCLSASKSQLQNQYFKKAKRLEFCQCGKKILKSICAPAFWELIKINPALGRKNVSTFCSSVCNYLLPAFALWFACGGSLQGDRNLAG